MKQIVTLVILFVTISFSRGQYCGSNSSCAPDSTIAGLLTDYNDFGCIERGVPFSNSLSLKVPATYGAFGFNVTVQHIIVDSITNLPCDMCWRMNASGNLLPNNTYCINLEGNTQDVPGVYKVNIWIRASVIYNSLPLVVNGNFDATGSQFYVRVIDSTTQCPPVIIQPSDTALTRLPCGVVPVACPTTLPFTAHPFGSNPCNYDSVVYSLSPAFTNVQWIFFDTLLPGYDTIRRNSLNAYHLPYGLEEVRATDTQGCVIKMVQPQPASGGLYKRPRICIATLDSALGKNLIVWNRDDDSYSSSITAYNVYSSINDTLLNPSTLIGTVMHDAPTILIDTVNPPLTGVIKYQLRMVDTCGFEIMPKDVFAPPYLRVDTQLGIANLRWNYYGNDYFIYSMQVWRTTDSINWQQIPVGISNLTQNEYRIFTFNYSEPVPPSGVVEYMIQYSVPSPCIPSPQRAASYHTVYSNRVRLDTVEQVTTGIGSISGNAGVTLHPNPAKNLIYISTHLTGDGRSDIFTVTGRHVAGKEITLQANQAIDISLLPAGVYFMTVKSEQYSQTLKFVKQ